MRQKKGVTFFMTRNLIEIPQLTDDGRLTSRAIGHCGRADSQCAIPQLPCGGFAGIGKRRLLCVWFAGSSEGNADIYRRQPPEGRESQWEAVRLKISGITQRNSETNPSVLRHPNEKFKYIRRRLPARQIPLRTSAYGTLRRFAAKTTDQGRTLGKNRSAV